MLRKALAILTLACVSGSCLPDNAEVEEPFPRPEEIKKTADRVFEWQTAHHPRGAWNNGWLNATLYSSIVESGKMFGDERYLNAALEWAEHHQWKIGRRRMNADDQACAQTYLGFYELYGEEYMIEDTKEVMDAVAATNLKGRELWSWCDALFMGPPVLAKLGALTGDDKYYRVLNEKYWDVYDYLYDPDEQLFYRDPNYFNIRDTRGRKVFWSRGNGWVLAGLVKILGELPEGNRRYKDYLNLYRKMVTKIVTLQANDGLWRTNLLSPHEYPDPETSGSVFFCYAIAWGINQEILVDEKYLTALVKGWKGLTSKIDANGKLGWVQSVAQRPGPVIEENSEIYATGAFLMAAGEMYKLALEKYQ